MWGKACGRAGPGRRTTSRSLFGIFLHLAHPLPLEILALTHRKRLTLLGSPVSVVFEKMAHMEDLPAIERGSHIGTSVLHNLMTAVLGD